MREALTFMEDTRDLKEERKQATSRREVFQAKGTVSLKACAEAGACVAHLWKGRKANEAGSKAER